MTNRTTEHGDGQRRRPLLVGYDGSAASESAMGWALAEAARRAASITVIESWHEPLISEKTWHERWDDPNAEELERAAALKGAVRAAAVAHPALVWESHVTGEAPDVALLGRAEDHELVVVGTRGRGGATGLRIGSVAERVVGASPTTVVVVPSEEPAGSGIVIGVDGSASSRRALRWAATEGQLRAVPVRAVLAWTDLTPVGRHGLKPLSAGMTPAEERITLHQIIAEEIGADAAPELAAEVAYGAAASVLQEAADGAELLVIGAPVGSGRPHLSSLAKAVLRHGACPVAVVR